MLLPKINRAAGLALGFAAGLVFSYLVGAFCEWSFDPGQWTQNVRINTAVIGSMATAGFVGGFFG